MCYDLDLGSEGQSSKKLRDLILEYDPEFLDSYELKIDAVPGVGSNREPALDNIRIELMSGGGADLFLCKSPKITGAERQTGLFQYPKALMKRHVFLSLDDYIENAKYMEWDKLYPEIMEAGRNGEGQLILPIGWSMNFVPFDVEGYTPTAELPMTFDEMLKSDDPGIIEITCLSCFPDSLGLLADYENDVPSFTKEELTAHLDGILKNRERRTSEMTESIGRHRAVTFGRMNSGLFSQYDPDSVLIPHYNRDGGVTASITSFGAVNINAKEPEVAFEILDLLMSKEVQQNSELLSWDRGAPVHMDLLKKDEKVFAPVDLDNGTQVDSWGLTDYNYEQLQTLIKQINAVDFFTPVHYELSDLYIAYMQAETKEEREKLVAEAYKNIDMMLAES